MIIMSFYSSRATSAATAAAAAAALLCLISSATHAGVAAAEIDPLLPICKTVGGGSTYFGIDFCMAALGSDGRSRRDMGSEDPALSAIAVDLLTANATSTAAKIDGLLLHRHRSGGAGDGDATTTRQSAALRSCQALYAGVVRRQPGCAAAVRARRYGDATSALEASASAAKQCEAGFAGRGAPVSPLTAEDENAFRLAKLAVALLRFTF